MRHKRQDARQAFVQQLLDHGQETPEHIDHNDDPAFNNPHQRIREYLTTLCGALGESLPSDWPDAPAVAYQDLYGRLRRSCEQLYAYAERAGAGKSKRELRDQRVALRLLGESAAALLELNYNRPQGWARASDDTIATLTRRPFPKLSLDQLYCTPDSTERRAIATVKSLTATPAAILCLGDDDLGSLLLRQRCDAEIHVMDFDQRLLDHIQAEAPSIHCHQRDLVMGGLPRTMCERFDAVVLDPPWDAYGAWNFIDKAILALKPGLHGRIFLSFCPVYIEHIDRGMATFWKRLAARGLTCERIERAFHLYSLEGTQFSQLLQHQLPDLESPLFACLRQVPYGFSHLYVLRRLAGAPKAPLSQMWRRWWHTET